MLIEQLGVSGQHPSAERIFPWEWEGFTCAAPSRTQPILSPSAGKVLGGQCQDRRAKYPISAHSQVLERQERSWQSAGDILDKNQGFGFAKAAAQPLGTQRPALQLRGVLNLWAPSAPASPTRAGNSCGSRHGSGEGCGSREPSQAAKSTFPPRPPSCWVTASCSCSVALPADPACGTTQELLLAS